jgi:hypothetical protein
VLASYGLKTGDVGYEVISVSPVHGGKLLDSRFTACVKRTYIPAG